MLELTTRPSSRKLLACAHEWITAHPELVGTPVEYPSWLGLLPIYGRVDETWWRARWMNYCDEHFGERPPRVCQVVHRIAQLRPHGDSFQLVGVDRNDFDIGPVVPITVALTDLTGLVDGWIPQAFPQCNAGAAS